MADRIDEIISQEAFEQINRLFDQLGKCTDRMAEMVMQTKEMADVLGKATSIKDTAKAIEGLDVATEQLTQTQSERLNIEREIKAEGQKMKQVLDDEIKLWGKVEAAMDKSSLNTYDMVQAQLNLKTKLKEVSQSIKEIEKQHEQYRKGVAGVTDITDKQREKLVDYVEQQGLYKQQISELNIALKNEAKNMNAAEGSYDEMNAQLGRLRDKYRQLSEAERESEDIGGVLMQGINQLDEKLKAIDKTMGNNQRNVGNYEIAGKSLRLQMRELTMQLQELTIKSRSLDGDIKNQKKLTEELARAKGTESAEYQEANAKLHQMKNTYNGITSQMTTLTTQAGNMRDAMSDSSRAIAGMAQDAAGLKVATTIAGDMVGAYNAVQMGLVALGADQKDLMQVYAKMQIIQQGLNSLNQIANDLQKEGIVRVRARAMWEKVSTTWKTAFVKKQAEQVVTTAAETTATEANTAAQVKNNAATTAGAAASTTLAAGETAATATSWTLTGALKAVGVAIKSIPVIGWILAAVAALGTLTALIIKHNKEEMEGNVIMKQRNALIDAESNARKSAIESVAEEKVKLEANLKLIKKSKEGTDTYNQAVKDTATQLGVSEEWLKKNIDRVGQLGQLWIEIKKTQALADAYAKESADASIKAEKLKLTIQGARNKDYDDREEYIKSMGYAEDEAKNIMKAISNDIKMHNYEYTKVLIKDMTSITNSVVDNASAKMEELAGNIATLTSQYNDLTKGSKNDGKSTKSSCSTAKNDNSNVENLKAQLKEQANAVLLANLEMREKLIRENAATGDEMADQLIDINNERYSILLGALEDEKKLKLSKLKEGSDEYILTSQLYDGKIAELNKKWYADEEKIRDEQNKAEFEAERAKNEAIYNEAVEINKKKEEEAKKTAEYNKKLEDSYYALASAISDAFFTIIEAIADGIEDEKKQVKVQQALALVEVNIQGALAVIKAVNAAVTDGTKIGWIAAAIEMVAATAAVTAQIIKATNAIKNANTSSVAAYAEGTDYHTGGDAIVGEAGYPEMVNANGKQFVVDQPTLIKNLPVGSKVVPLTERAMSTFGTVNMDIANEYLRQLAQKQVVSINIGRDVTYYLTNGQNRTQILNKRFNH